MNERKILSSWKEISNYLGIQVRTAQRWEKELNLPVFRLEKLKKTYVIAYCDDIDKWLREKQNSKAAKKSFKKRVVFIVSWIFIALTLVIFLIIAKRAPVTENNGLLSYKIFGGLLTIVAQNGEELWNYDLKTELNTGEYGNKWPKKSIYFKDIDKNGLFNVIIATQNKENFNEKIFCFNHKGKFMWRILAGKEIRYGDKVFSPDLSIKKIKVVDLEGDG